MSVTVSTDLSVSTAPGQMEQKLEEKRLFLQESIKKGEPKIFGVTQITLGLLIISYSLPLLFAKSTLLTNIGVPWWSGIMFVISGATAIAVEMHTRSKTITVCLSVSVMAIIVSLVAIALYYIEIGQNITNKFCSAVMTAVSILTVAQTAVSSAFTAILYNVKKKNNFAGYVTMNK